MIGLVLIVLFFLVVASILDLYIKKVPSIFLTGLIFIVALVNLSEITFGMIHLSFGIISFIFAWMLYEADFIGGVADIKIIIVIGMLCSTVPTLMIFFGLIAVFGVLYKGFWIYGLKRKQYELIPFVPCLLWIFLTLWLGGALI